MRTIDDMVRQEVVHNCSFLISTLAAGYGTLHPGATDLDDMCEQAMELCAPLLDYEEAATEAHWACDMSTGNTTWFNAGFFRSAAEAHHNAQQDRTPLEAHENEYLDSICATYVTAEAVCNCKNIEPHEREIFEHWIVTDWLAGKLEDKGERIDRDFAGLCVWGRTTTGQGIAMDSIVQEIHREACASYLREFHGEPRDGHQRLDFVTPDGGDEPTSVYASEDSRALYLADVAKMAGWRLAGEG